jgi:hypothetical protein
MTLSGKLIRFSEEAMKASSSMANASELDSKINAAIAAFL